jgi:hypothetical protein
VDLTDRHSVQVVELLSTFAMRGHQVRLIENTEMLHHTEAGHRGKRRADHSDGQPAGRISQQVKNGTSGWVSQGPEHVVHIEGIYVTE